MNYGKGWIMMGVYDDICRVVDVLRCAKGTGSHTGHRTKKWRWWKSGDVQHEIWIFEFLNF